jgi:hypothetical protein
MKKTAGITLTDIKDHAWYELGQDLGLSDDESSKVFEYGEYGSITIIVDKNLNIVGGHIHGKHNLMVEK